MSVLQAEARGPGSGVVREAVPAVRGGLGGGRKRADEYFRQVEGRAEGVYDGAGGGVVGGLRMKSKRCPKCGAREEAGCKFEIRGPLEGIWTCECCQFMWSVGSAPGRGIEWWSDLIGWIRAPEGCLHVLRDV